MDDNEDEPEDVRKATPVAGEIESGRKDEKADNPKTTRSEKKDANKSSRCRKDAKKPTLAKSEADCCRSKITKPSKTPKAMSVMVYSPPCTLPRLGIIPRHCLSKREYINVLAAPSRKCPPECFGRTVVRKIRPISARTNELAQPARRLIVSTLEERGETLPPEMINNLVKSIEGSACMTPEQAEEYFRDKERGKERKAVKAHGRQKCKGKSKRDQCSSQLDKEAVMCQYLMAEKFVKSILQWKCPIPVEEFQDIAGVILRRLSFVLEYSPIDGQDVKSQQMRFLADVIACWISGVLFEVAEEHKKEIEEESIARGEEEEEEDEEDEEDVGEVGGIEKPVEETDDDEEENGKKEEPTQQKNEGETQDSGAQNGKVGGDQDKAPENSVVVKTEPLDADENSPEELADREKARKEAEEREQEKLAAEKKRLQEQEEERARQEAEERAKMEELAANEARLKVKLEKEEEARREKEAEEQKLREEEEEEKRKKKQQEEEEANKLKIEAEEKKKREQQEKEEEEERKKKELEEEAERMKKELEDEEAKRLKKEQAEEEEKRLKKEREEKEKKKQQEQEKAEKDEKEKLAEDQKKKKKEEIELKEKGPKKAIEVIGDGELFKTDLPFVTFGKILDTVYDMLEEEPEGDETDMIHNRIQRSLYEKFARLIELEAPDSLTENLKDVVDVFAGKAATWVKRLLKDSELKFMEANPAEVESKEIRDWGKWIDQVTDRAGDWADWIHRVVNEAEEKSATIVRRGDWQDWTSDTETNALLWRRYYLETVHQAHHNKMMVADRPVVKTGLPAVEEEINSTDLAA